MYCADIGILFILSSKDKMMTKLKKNHGTRHSYLLNLLYKTHYILQ